MSALTDFAAIELATLSRIVPAPVAPLGYGVDLSCVTDIAATLAEVPSTTVAGLRESLLRRLQTPRGFLGGIEDDQNYGFDVVGMLNAGTTQQGLRGIEAGVRDEIAKDDRLLSATVSAEYTSTTSTLTVSASCIARDPAIGNFALIFSVNALGKLVSEVG
jgi:hypothetical protein